MGDGVGAGFNTKAMVMTRSLREMSKLGEALGGQRDTFGGLAGMGDLTVTCISPLSRNRHVGECLGKGQTVEEILAEYDGLEREDIQACLLFASRSLASTEFAPLQLQTA